MERFDFPRPLEPTQPYGPPAHDSDTTTESTIGDSGPWTWLLAETWQQAAAPDNFAGPRRRPAVPYDTAPGHYDLIAYWAPFVSLMHHGLGWRRPDLGLWRWRHEGAKFDDPVLRTLHRRYGSDIDLMVAWLTSDGSYLNTGQSDTRSRNDIPLEMKRHCDLVRSTDAYRASFGPEGDQHHLGYHIEPFQETGSLTLVSAEGSQFGGQSVDSILVGDRFHDVFWGLRSGGVSPTTRGRSTRVALVWPSGGWLGNFRRSRTTKLWFRGRHAVHELGNSINP